MIGVNKSIMYVKIVAYQPFYATMRLVSWLIE